MKTTRTSTNVLHIWVKLVQKRTRACGSFWTFTLALKPYSGAGTGEKKQLLIITCCLDKVVSTVCEFVLLWHYKPDWVSWAIISYLLAAVSFSLMPPTEYGFK